MLLAESVGFERTRANEKALIFQGNFAVVVKFAVFS